MRRWPRKSSRASDSSTAGRRPDGLNAFAMCALVIEAIVERLDTKRDAFARMERVVADGCVLATNTSSLAVAAIASACKRPERVLGVHFFNPAPVMPLVEIIPWLGTCAGGHDADARSRRFVAQDDRPRHRHARLHRQPGGASLLRRSPSHLTMKGLPMPRRSTGPCASSAASAWDLSSSWTSLVST